MATAALNEPKTWDDPIIPWTPFIPHKPHKKQLAAMLIDKKELLFGGAAGGGKSDWLLMSALQFVDVPYYSAIIFRKTLSDLKQEESLITRASEWLSEWYPYVKWVAEDHAFVFPSRAKLAFGYIGEFRTNERYQGAAYQFVGFDELTQHFEEDYLYLFSRARRTQCEHHAGRKIDGKKAPLPDDPRCRLCHRFAPLRRVPVRIRATCNPGGPGHTWVKNRFGIAQDATGQWVGTNPKRPFMPSRIEDNPSLDLDDYHEMLMELDPLTREQLRWGYWGAPENARFKYRWFNKYETSGDRIIIERQTKEGPPIRQQIHRLSLQIFITTDPAASTREGIAGVRFHQRVPPSHAVISVWGVTPWGDLLWLDMDRMQTESPEYLQRVRQMVKLWSPSYIVCEAIGVGLPIFQMLSSMGIPVEPLRSVPDKIANSVEAQVRSEQGKVFLPRQAGWMKEVEDEVFTWTGHPHQTADIVDTFSNACHQVTRLAGEDQFDPYCGAQTPGAYDVNVDRPF